MKICSPLAVGLRDAIKPKKKALKRVTKKAEGALKGNSSVLRMAVAAAQEGWWRPNKGDNSGLIMRAKRKGQEGSGDTFGPPRLLARKEEE